MPQKFREELIDARQGSGPACSRLRIVAAWPGEDTRSAAIELARAKLDEAR